MLQTTPAYAGPLIQLNTVDNVLTTREELSLGANLLINRTMVCLRMQMLAGHKIAARRTAQGGAIRKYNVIVGCVARDTVAGEHVHTYNVKLVDCAHNPDPDSDMYPVDYTPEVQRAIFSGIVRLDGHVVTHSFIGILASTNYPPTIIKNIAAWFMPERLVLFPNVDGMVAFVQTSGCGVSSPSEHFDVLCHMLVGYARHPSLVSMLIVGLDCERNQVVDLITGQGLKIGDLMHMLVIQDAGGTRATIEVGIMATVKILLTANDIAHCPVSASHIKIGPECGGSNGFPGITTNPTFGAATDLLIRYGSTAILPETPEVRNVETVLTRRAVSPEVGQKLLNRLAWWEGYICSHNGRFNSMVRPDNQQGGLTDIFEKSLGSTMKGDITPLQVVYEYAEPIDHAGFAFMSSPGYNPVAMTDQTTSNANLVCFTTGCGSMFGLRPVPTIKFASNTPISYRFEEDMDINCGRILNDERPVEEIGQDIFEHILRTALGERTKSKLLDLGDHEFVP